MEIGFVLLIAAIIGFILLFIDHRRISKKLENALAEKNKQSLELAKVEESCDNIFA